MINQLTLTDQVSNFLSFFSFLEHLAACYVYYRPRTFHTISKSKSFIMARQRSKAASSKAIPPKKKSPKVPASVKDDKMILLWMCLANHSGEVSSLVFQLFKNVVHSPNTNFQIDFDAVGAAYGISRNSAQQRYYRLRAFMTMQTLPGQKAPAQVPTDDEENLEEVGEEEEGKDGEDDDEI